MDKNVSNASVYLNGNYTGVIRLEYFGGYPVLEYPEDSLPKKLSSDFYGGKLKVRILPSNTEGELKIKIQIPYGP